jgi:hypothetical protein
LTAVPFLSAAKLKSAALLRMKELFQGYSCEEGWVAEEAHYETKGMDYMRKQL